MAQAMKSTSSLRVTSISRII